MTYRALVVEDEEVAAEANAAYLGRLGLEVVGIARSGRDALRLLAAEPIDLVLLDMHLPDGHGMSLLRQLRAHSHPADVIAVTSARDVDTVRQVVGQGVIAYLIKPFTFLAFRSKVEQFVAYRDRLADQHGTVGQSEVDAVLAALRPVLSSQTLPKGLTAGTVEVVSTTVRQHGPLSASEVAEHLGTSRVTARRYLEYLAEAGMVERAPRYGGTGRPELLYAWK